MRSSVSETFPYHTHLPYVTSCRARGRRGGWGGSFDAVVGAALLSVVDLPDLSTVNIQG